jgi:hypothetical protein
MPLRSGAFRGIEPDIRIIRPRRMKIRVTGKTRIFSLLSGAFRHTMGRGAIV